MLCIGNKKLLECSVGVRAAAPRAPQCVAAVAFSHLKTSSGEASGERQRGQETAALVPQVTSAQVSAEVAALPPERGDGAGRGPREAATPPGRRGRGGRRLLSRWPCLPLLCRRQAVDLRHHLRDLILQPLSKKKDRRGGGASASLLLAQGGAAPEVLPGPAGAGTPVPVTGPVRAAQRREPAGLCSAASQRRPGVHWAGRGVHAQGRPGHRGHRRGVKGLKHKSRASRFGHAARVPACLPPQAAASLGRPGPQGTLTRSEQAPRAPTTTGNAPGAGETGARRRGHFTAVGSRRSAGRCRLRCRPRCPA